MNSIAQKKSQSECATNAHLSAWIGLERTHTFLRLHFVSIRQTPKPSHIFIHSINVSMRLDLVQLQREITCVNKWFLFISIFFFAAALFFCSQFILAKFFSSFSHFILLVLDMAIDVSLLTYFCFYVSSTLFFFIFTKHFCCASSSYFYSIYLSWIACNSVRFKASSSSVKTTNNLHMYMYNYNVLKAERKTNYRNTITEKLYRLFYYECF